MTATAGGGASTGGSDPGPGGAGGEDGESGATSSAGVAATDGGTGARSFLGGGGSGGSSPAGGAAVGGVDGSGAASSLGGADTGGEATGGVTTGGRATGGRATGGEATGGEATGGEATGGEATGGEATGGSGAVGGGGTTSSGCGEPAPFTGRKALTVAVGGVQRQYDALVPASYDPERPLAIVFVFHGGDGYIDEAMSWSGELREYGDAGESAVFLFPQGLPFQDYGVGWDEACEGVDMPFFDAMLRQTAESFCVATDRVFATGFSWGGDFVNALGCCRAEAIRGLVSLSGGEWGPEIGANGDCGSAPMPPYRLLYGDQDTAYSSEAFESVLQMFADANHCDSGSEPVDPSPCVVRTGCDRPVSECRYAGLVHAFAPNWAEATWAFFSSLM